MPINNSQNRLLRSRGPKDVEGLIHLERVGVARSPQLASAQGWISHRVLLAGPYNFAGSQQFLQPECIIDLPALVQHVMQRSTSTVPAYNLISPCGYRSDSAPEEDRSAFRTNLPAELKDMSIANVTLVRSHTSWSARGLVGLVGPELARLPVC
jgi:hypothetical protein